MAKYRQKMLPVVDSPELAIVQLGHNGAWAFGDGDWDYICAHCDVLTHQCGEEPSRHWRLRDPNKKVSQSGVGSFPISRGQCE